MGAVTSSGDFQTIATFPGLRHLEERSLYAARPSLLHADAMRVLLDNEVHAGELTGTKPVPGEENPVNVIRSIMPNPFDLYKEPPAPEKEEKLELVQSDETEVQDSGTDSRPEEVELNCNEEVELKSDAEVDIELLHELMHQMYDLQIKVKERKEWAQKRALQAAKKVSNDFLELRTLRMKREAEERMKNENKAKADERAKMMAELEEQVNRTEEEVERAQMEVKWLKKENREMEAAIQAARLETSETNKKCNRLENRLKRINKNAEMSEKQMLVLQEEVEEVMRDNAKFEEQIEAVRKEISASEVRIYHHFS